MKTNKFRTLSTRLIVIHLLLAFLLLGAISLCQWIVGSRYVDRTIVSQGRLVARMLQPACIDPVVRTLAYDRIPMLIDKIYTENRNITYVIIHDLIGHVAAAIGMSVPEKLSMEKITELYNQPVSDIIQQDSKTADLEFAVILAIGENVIGLARIGMNRENLMKEQVNRIVFFIGATMLFFVATSLIYFIYTEKRVIGPLFELGGLMERFGRDKPEKLIAPIEKLASSQPNNEISWMTQSFKKMINTIIQRDGELQIRSKELKEQKEKLETIANGVGIGLAIISKDHKVVWANQILKTIYDEPVGRYCYDAFEQGTSACPSCGVDDIIAGEKRQVLMEQKLITSKGDTIWNQVQITPYFSTEGEIVGALEARTDITRQKDIEKALLENEARYKAVLEAAADPIVIYDIDGRVIYTNPAFSTIFGWQNDELSGKRIDYVPEKNRAETQRMIEKIISGQRFSGFETQRYNKAGNILDVSMSAATFKDPAGNIQGSVISLRDISDRKQLEAQFLQAQKMEAIGRLAGGVAHDLNNLLSPILGYGEMLLNDLKLDDTKRKQVDQIVQAGIRARDLVRQLLAFSRKQALAYKSIDLNKTIFEFQKLLRRTIREDIEIKIVPKQDIRPIKADIGQIEQVIMNLAVNAADAMPDGGRLTIETDMARLDKVYASLHLDAEPGEYIMLIVSDTGRGMDGETRKHLFEPFFSTKGPQGTGLGLATVYGIVKQHGGNILVYSEPGRGTTFKVYLPVSEETASKKKTATEQYPENTGKETILIVEDNKRVRNLGHAILKLQGYTVLVAENGSRALSVLEEQNRKVQLLLTDVVMPGMNGKELFAKAVEQYPDLKVLYMSGYTNDIIAHRGVLEEGIAFVKKPFSVQSLTSKVREVLDEQRLDANSC